MNLTDMYRRRYTAKVRSNVAKKLKKIPAFFYQSASGAEPVRDWLKSLEDEDKQTIGEDIATVEFS